MIRREKLTNRIKKAILGLLFAFLALFGGFGTMMLGAGNAYADEASGPQTDEDGNVIEDGDDQTTPPSDQTDPSDETDQTGDQTPGDEQPSDQTPSDGPSDDSNQTPSDDPSGDGDQTDQPNDDQTDQSGDNQPGDQPQDDPNADADQTDPNDETDQTEQPGDESDETDQTDQPSNETTSEKGNKNGKSCQDSLGVIGWLICPVTGKLAEAVDWLYDRIEGILVINPVKIEDGAPIYEIWKYCLGVTNIVFVIFLLIVIYSQVTGLGMTNYGIKRALPKLIVMAVMINLSFLICSVAVDASNVIGMGLRNLFKSIEETVAQNSTMNMTLGLGGIFSAIGGAALTVGAAVIAFDSGMIWMLIPVVFGAIVSVVIGLITIALRQALVVLLIMIAPLAMACCILPNTEQWYNRWKQLLIQMLIFYPMFSLLYGASSLAGFAIIYSATDGFGLILGTAVQVLPLFFSWSLMKMSGTVLGTVSSKLQGITAGARGKVWTAADQQRQLSRARHLASGSGLPSRRLMQYLSDRQIAREAELSEHQRTIQSRGEAYRAQRNYRRDGTPSRTGERTYAETARNLEYQRTVLRDQNNMNRGLEPLLDAAEAEGAAAGAATATATRRRAAQRARAAALDERMMNASDYLKAEQVRSDQIAFENAQSFHERMTRAIDAHLDDVNGYERKVDENGEETVTPREAYRMHANANAADLARYNAINKIMDGNVANTHLVAASAAQAYDTQRKVVETKMDKYFDLTETTKDVELKLNDLTKSKDATANIDSIIAGLRIMNKRGDTDLVREQLQNVLDQGVELGTHASQALGNFLMFEVKDSDPFLRRFGKYINLETAMIYSANKRTNPVVTLDEMVTGEYTETDPETGEVVVRHSKMSLDGLMQGTSLGGIERTAMKDLDDMLQHAYRDENGKLDIPKYLARRREIETAIGPAFISASMSFSSGSEQLKALVSFLTGYDKNGKARWEPGGDLADDAEEAEAYFRAQTLQYLDWQTPAQLLGLRSDYYTPLMEHLSKAYIEDDMEGWSDEEREEHAALVAELSDIQTRYGDLPPEEAARKRAADAKALKNKRAGAEFRKRLDSKGKLEQIYRTRRSGAANSAKDWVREWLGLDDEAAINEWLHTKYKSGDQKRPEPERRRETPDADEDVPPETGGGFSDADREDFATRLQAEYDEWSYTDGADVDAFYEESCQFVRDNLRDVGDYILRQYADYREARPRATARELLEELQRLLRNRDNY